MCLHRSLTTCLLPKKQFAFFRSVREMAMCYTWRVNVMWAGLLMRVFSVSFHLRSAAECTCSSPCQSRFILALLRTFMSFSICSLFSCLHYTAAVDGGGFAQRQTDCSCQGKREVFFLTLAATYRFEPERLKSPWLQFFCSSQLLLWSRPSKISNYVPGRSSNCDWNPLSNSRGSSDNFSNFLIEDI